MNRATKDFLAKRIVADARVGLRPGGIRRWTTASDLPPGDYDVVIGRFRYTLRVQPPVATLVRTA